MSYQIQQYIAAAVESVLASGQSYVATVNIQKNRDTTTSTLPRYEIEVGNVARASMQMMSVSSGVLVAGLDYVDSSVNGNGLYQPIDTLNGRTRWYLNGDTSRPSINWSGTLWRLDPEDGTTAVIGQNSVSAPWLEGSWDDGTVGSVAEFPRLVYNHFTADATVSIVTERGSATDHAAAVSRTRYLFSQEAQAFVSPVVTAFEVLALEPTGEAQDVNEEAREDWSKLGFRFEIGLIPGAYVVPSSG